MQNSEVPSVTELTAPAPLLNKALSPTATRLLRLPVLNKAPVPTATIRIPASVKIIKLCIRFQHYCYQELLYRIASLPNAGILAAGSIQVHG